MSGVFGVVLPDKGESIDSILSNMANKLKLCPWHKIFTWQDEDRGVGLGQLNIGIFSSEQRYAFFTKNGTTVSFFGEILNQKELRHSLSGTHFACNTKSEAELALNLYLTYREDLPKYMEGTFQIAIWDDEKGKLFLFNDRLGLLPLYYCVGSNGFIFAPLIAATLNLPDFSSQLNMEALAEFMRFQRLLSDHTYFKNVKLLPYGSVLKYDLQSGHCDIYHYWDFDQVALNNKISFKDSVDEAGRLLRQAIRKNLSGDYRLGIYLSGGLDSRTLLGFACQEGPALPSITYGYSKSHDVLYARQIARKLGSQNHFFPQPNGAWLKDYVDLHLSITEGQQSFIHAHASLSLNPARQFLDVNLPGFNGDQLLGGRAIQYADSSLSLPDETAFLGHLFHDFNQNFSWPGITEAEEKLLYLPDIYLQVRDSAFESLKQSLIPFSKYAPIKRLDYFTTIYQGTRLSNLNTIYQRAFIEARYPFCDHDFADFIFSLPIEYRFNDRLYLAMITQEIPKVTLIPRDTDRLLPTTRQWIRGPHGLAQKSVSRIQQKFFPSAYRSQQLHGDPEDWLRDDLCDWSEEILFDKRTLDRGIFNPEFIRSIFDRHMSGNEIWTIGKIGPIITIELMLRKFFDE